MPDPKKLMNNILGDMRVELADEFDKNFDRSGFFDKKWPARKKEDPGPGRKLLIGKGSGHMRRSIKASIIGNGIHFSSSLPYTAVHNEGGAFKQRVKAHTRKVKGADGGTKFVQVRSFTRNMVMPERRFIGDDPKVQSAIEGIVDDNVEKFFKEFADELRK